MRPQSKTFEVAVHNREVRAALGEGRRHRQLRDDWADTHYIEVTAPDAGQARRKAEARYPEHKGFVIEQIVQVRDDH